MITIGKPMKKPLFILILFAFNNAYSSSLTVGESCVINSLPSTCTTTPSVFNDNGTKACLWKTTGNTVEVKSC